MVSRIKVWSKNESDDDIGLDLIIFMIYFFTYIILVIQITLCRWIIISKIFKNKLVSGYQFLYKKLQDSLGEGRRSGTSVLLWHDCRM